MIALSVRAKEMDLSTRYQDSKIFLYLWFLLSEGWHCFCSYISGDSFRLRPREVPTSVPTEVLRMLKSALPWARCTAGSAPQTSQGWLLLCWSRALGLQCPETWVGKHVTCSKGFYFCWLTVWGLICLVPPVEGNVCVLPAPAACVKCFRPKGTNQILLQMLLPYLLSQCPVHSLGSRWEEKHPARKQSSKEKVVPGQLSRTTDSPVAAVFLFEKNLGKGQCNP